MTNDARSSHFQGNRLEFWERGTGGAVLSPPGLVWHEETVTRMDHGGDSVREFERAAAPERIPVEKSVHAPFQLAANASTDVAFRRQESVIVLFNIATLLALAGIVLGFRPWMPSLEANIDWVLFVLRAAEQMLELAYLRWRTRPFSERQVRWYGHVSIWVNVVFAGLVSVIASTDEAHYLVLLLIPVVAACFRYTLRGLLLVIAAVSMLAFLELVVFYWRFPPMETEHFFEMATMVLIYPVIGVIAWVLVNRIRENALRLETALSELRETRDRLVDEEKHAAIGRLASAMAHEIRNPVAMIVSALDGERRERSEPETENEFRMIAAREAGRLERLTTDFLAYARSKAPDWKRVPVASTLDYVARLTTARAGGRNLRVEVRCAAADDAWMDEFLIHQALLNLTLNAVEHTPDHGRILIGAEQSGDRLEVYVENNGEAIPAESVPRVFEPFFTTRTAGTGLGLAISQRIAERHGGTLGLSRNLPGAVRFTLAIPQDAASRSGAVEKGS